MIERVFLFPLFHKQCSFRWKQKAFNHKRHVKPYIGVGMILALFLLLSGIYANIEPGIIRFGPFFWSVYIDTLLVYCITMIILFFVKLIRRDNLLIGPFYLFLILIFDSFSNS